MASIVKIPFNFTRLRFTLDMCFDGVGRSLRDAIDNKKMILILLLRSKWSFVLEIATIE